jgi:uncharacterized protein
LGEYIVFKSPLINRKIEKMKEYILITGATSGIGFEMAQQLAAMKHNLILASRNVEKMLKMQTSLTSTYGIDVQFFEVDLTIPQEAIDLHQNIHKKEMKVTHLVNNAGFGGYGEFLETSLDHELDMVNLNVSSLMVLTKLFAQDMAQNKRGHIMNVASILSFLPFPYYSVYSATKAFVLAFTETVASEMEASGVIITALCPGTVETPFHTTDMRKTKAMRTNKPMSASVVAEAGIKLLLHGKGKKIVGFNNWFISNLPRFTPDFIMMKIKKNLATIQS